MNNNRSLQSFVFASVILLLVPLISLAASGGGGGSGSGPIVGGSGGGTIGTAFVTLSSFDPNAPFTEPVSTKGYIFTGIRITTGLAENETLNSITWHQSGTASGFQSVVTVVGGASYPTTFDATTGRYTSTFSPGIVITAGSSTDAYVQGDLGTTAHTYAEFDIDHAADISLVGSTSSSVITPSDASSGAADGTSNHGTIFVSGTNPTPWIQGSTVNVAAGYISLIQNASSIPAQNIATSTPIQPLGGFILNVAGEPITVQSLTFNVATSTGSDRLTNVSLIEQGSEIGFGPVDETWIGNQGELVFTNPSPVTFFVGTTTYTIRGTVGSNAQNGTTYQLSTNPSAWTGAQGQISGDSISIGETNFTMNTMTVNTASAVPVTNITLSGAAWSTVGTPGFSQGGAANTSLYVANGTPYVAYSGNAPFDNVNDSTVTVMKYNGTSWVNVGNPDFSQGGAYWTSLYVDNGTPYVAFDGGFDNGFKASVMKYDGTSWVYVGTPDFSQGEVNFLSLYVSNGTPYVAYSDASQKATVMKYDGTNWVNVGTPGFSQGSAGWTSLYVYNGTPYVAYAEATTGGSNTQKASVMKYDGTSWVTVGIPEFSPNGAQYTSLYVYNGTPYVAFDGAANNNFKASVMKYDGTSWAAVGSPGFSQGPANETSLYVYNGTPYVAYSDNANIGKASVMQYDGTSWVNVGNPDFSQGPANETSLYVSDGIPYVAYFDFPNNGKATVMKFNSAATSVSSGSTMQMSAAVLPSGASQSVTWSVGDKGDTGLAIIDPSTGVLTAESSGTVTVTATATDGSGVTGIETVTVIGSAPPEPQENLTLTANPTSLNITPSTVVPETGGMGDSYPISNATVDAATSGLTPIAVTVQNTGNTASANVTHGIGISPGAAGTHTQLWVKDADGNWSDIVRNGWGFLTGFSVPAGQSTTTNVYVISDTAGSLTLTVNLTSVGGLPIFVTVATATTTVTVAPVASSPVSSSGGSSGGGGGGGGGGNGPVVSSGGGGGGGSLIPVALPNNGGAAPVTTTPPPKGQVLGASTVRCNFTIDLYLGVSGADVLCLQQYLNSSGFPLASSGPGSPGNESNYFGPATQAAVIKWQIANGVSPASGYFGPLSRATYDGLINGVSPGSSGNSSTTSSQASTLPGKFTLTAGSPVCSPSQPTTPSFTLTWTTSAGATGYTVYVNGTAVSSAAGNSFVISQSEEQTESYSVQAYNAAGATNSNSVTVTVPSVLCPAQTVTTTSSPSATITASQTQNVPYGSSVTITWSASGVNSCTIEPTGWTGTTGSQTETMTHSVTYTLACNDSAGSISKVAVVTVASQTCDFGGKDLSEGSRGPAVLCLQQYLNQAGFIITWSGAGSPGNETDYFGPLMKRAVIDWQTAKGISSATGDFGADSRAMYLTTLTDLPSNFNAAAVTNIRPKTEPLYQMPTTFILDNVPYTVNVAEVNANQVRAVFDAQGNIVRNFSVVRQIMEAQWAYENVIGSPTYKSEYSDEASTWAGEIGTYNLLNIFNNSAGFILGLAVDVYETHNLSLPGVLLDVVKQIVSSALDVKGFYAGLAEHQMKNAIVDYIAINGTATSPGLLKSVKVGNDFDASTSIAIENDFIRANPRGQLYSAVLSALENKDVTDELVGGFHEVVYDTVGNVSPPAEIIARANESLIDVSAYKSSPGTRSQIELAKNYRPENDSEINAWASAALVASPAPTPPVSCSPSWQTGSWGTCTGGQQTRTVNDSNSCGTMTNKPATTQSCTVACTPNWQTGSWGTCTSGQQTRTVTDANTCGTTANKPTTTQSCTVTNPVPVSPPTAPAACNFTRDLYLTLSGSDVLCLQQYLNTFKPPVALSGPGSPGNETNYFGGATQTAVAEWQAANGVSPAKGYFGAVSRAKYLALH